MNEANLNGHTPRTVTALRDGSTGMPGLQDKGGAAVDRDRADYRGPAFLIHVVFVEIARINWKFWWVSC